MKKLFKNIFLVIVLPIFLFCVFDNNTEALTTTLDDSNIMEDASLHSLYSSYEYVIEAYDVNIVVNENNTFDVIETIDAYFNTEKHGIYRKIPIKNTVEREDGTTSVNQARLSKLTVNNDYTKTTSDGYYVIKIGSADQTLTGEQSYVISYTYNIGKDPVKDADEFYYNLVGTQWDTVIGDVTFSITMPKDFDATKLGFTVGSLGSSDTTGITYSIDDNIITGNYDGVLDPYEGLTVRLALDDGYFVGASNMINPFIYVLLGLSVIFVLIAIYLWKKYGKDEPVIEPVEFYPPDDLNSVETAYAYKGSANSKDIVSLLIFLANKGYITISETNEKKLFTSANDFKITKVKDYDGDNEYEKEFLEGLFENANDKQEVTSKDLNDEFYKVINSILSKVNTRPRKYKLYEKTAENKKIYYILMAFIIVIGITALPMYEYGDLTSLFVSIIFPVVIIFVICSIVLSEQNIALKIIVTLIGIFIGGGMFISLIYPSLSYVSIYLYTYIIGIICTIIIVFFFNIISKRTPYGNQILGKIRGFKNFLETAEKDKLEELVNDDPKYFYNILPYTYVLGVSDEWIKKFETIAIESPDWYGSNDPFTMTHFAVFMNSTMSSAQTAMTSAPSSNGGGGGFSGGGFSGGGSGGGGGGSW